MSNTFDIDSQTGDLTALFNAASQLAPQPEKLEITRRDMEVGHILLRVPDGNGSHKLISYEVSATSERPLGRPRTRVVHTITGFNRALSRWGTSDTVVYADRVKHRFEAVLDDDPERDEVEPGFAHAHNRIHFNLIEHPAFTKIRKLETPQAHVDFANALEQLVPYIASPDWSVLSELINDFKVSARAEFRGRRQPDGSFLMTYTSETEGSGNIAVPARLTFRVPVFVGTETQTIEARFRYEPAQTTIRMAILLLGVDDLVDSIFDTIVGQVETDADQALVDGTPTVIS